MTAAAVTTQLHIPFPHRWVRIGFYHTTSGYVAATTYMNITLKRTAGTIAPQRFDEYLFHEEDVRTAWAGENYGETFEYPPGTYELILTGANTNLVFPVFIIQRLSG